MLLTQIASKQLQVVVKNYISKHFICKISIVQFLLELPGRGGCPSSSPSSYTDGCDAPTDSCQIIILFLPGSMFVTLKSLR